MWHFPLLVAQAPTRPDYDGPTLAYWAALLFVTLFLGGALLNTLVLLRYMRPWRALASTNMDAILARSWPAHQLLVVGIGLLAGHALLLPLLSLLTGWTMGMGGEGGRERDLALGAAAFPGTLLIVIVMLSRTGSGLSAFSRDRLSNLPLRLAQASAHYLMLFPVFLLAALTQASLFSALNFQPRTQQAIEWFQTSQPGHVVQIQIVILSVVVAPIVEELLFRGILFPVVTRWLGRVQGVVFVSLLFSFIHFHPSQYLALFVVGLAMNLSYLATGSLTTSIFLHAIFNGVSLVFAGAMTLA